MSSHAIVLCLSRPTPYGEDVRMYQKVAVQEAMHKPDILNCIARTMIQRMGPDHRRVVQQNKQMPNYGYPPTSTTGLQSHLKDFDKTCESPRKEPLKWFRVNDEMGPLNSISEPLDDLRIKVAQWLTPVAI